jgi:hypothetical protein
VSAPFPPYQKEKKNCRVPGADRSEILTEIKRKEDLSTKEKAG